MPQLPAECMETLMTCMKQKKLSIISIIDITVELQVKSKNEVVNFDNLLALRQTDMDRITKCDTLVKSTLANFDEDTKQYFQSILKSGESGEHPELGELATFYNTKLAEFASLNAKLMDSFKVRYNSALDDANNSRVNSNKMYK